MTRTIHHEPLAPFHIHFTCPHCQAVRQVPEQYVGHSGQCNACGGAIVIEATKLPRVSVAPRPRSWYRERSLYFEFCRDDYERARAEFPPIDDNVYWQRCIQETAQCHDRDEQVARWEKLVAEGLPWAVAYEYLVHHYVKEHDYARAYYICCVYFHGNVWRNPQCVGSSNKLLKIMRKLDKKMHPNFQD